MNASKLARWAALPTAAIVVTTAGAAFAEDTAPATTEAAETADPATDEQVPDDTEDETADGTDDATDVAAQVRAFLETDEGRALLAELVAAADLDRSQLEELEAAVVELQLAVREGAADRTATSMELDDLREQLRLLAASIAAEDEAEDAEEVDGADELEEIDDADAEAEDAGHRRGWQEKQAGQSRGWNAEDREVNEHADAEHGEKRGWAEKQDGEPRGERADESDEEVVEPAEERDERDRREDD